MKELEKLARQGLAALMDEGAQEASFSVTETWLREFNYEVDRFTLYRSTQNFSLECQSIENNRYGTVKDNQTDNIPALAKACLDAGRSAAADMDRHLADDQGFIEECSGPLECDEELLFARMKELIEDIRRDYGKISIEQSFFSHQRKRRCRHLSSGTILREERGEYSGVLMFSAHEGEKSSSFFFNAISMNDLDRPLIECGSFADDLKRVSEQIETKAAEGSYEGVCLLNPSCFGDFLEYTLGHFAGDQNILIGSSLWKDSLGEEVADPRLSVRCAPCDPRFVADTALSSEGYRMEDYDLIRRGVLENFMLSDHVARKTGKKRAPNDASPNYLLVPAGEQKLEEIIGSIERGILVMRFSGGEPAVNGDFSGVAKNGFLIENGKITDAIRETMISGNLASLMKDLYALSEETVNAGMRDLPWAAFNHVLISGNC